VARPEEAPVECTVQPAADCRQRRHLQGNAEHGEDHRERPTG